MRDQLDRVAVLDACVLARDSFVHGHHQLLLPHELQDLFKDRALLLDQGPPPTPPEERVLDLRASTDVALEAIVETIRGLLTEAGITIVTWEHPVSEPTRTSTPEALPLIERLQKLYPDPPDIENPGNRARAGSAAVT